MANFLCLFHYILQPSCWIVVVHKSWMRKETKYHDDCDSHFVVVLLFVNISWTLWVEWVVWVTVYISALPI